MIRTRTLTIIGLACLSASVLGIAFLLSSEHLIAAYQRSYAKRRVADVTAVSCAIESFRALHGQLPSAALLEKAEPQLVRIFQDPSVTIALLPSHYVVEEAESGLDNPTKWRVVDGRWEACGIGTPNEYLRQSESSIERCRRYPHRTPD